MSAFGFFDSTYCINLDTRKDRWEHAQEQFESVGIKQDVERFSALTGTIPIIYKKGLPGSTGHHGLLLSTAACIEKAKENKAESLLLFEDDVIFLEERSVIDAVVADLRKEKWGLFYFGGVMVKGVNPRPISKHLLEIDNKGRGLICTHAYAIHNSCFDTFLKGLETNKRPIDQYLSRAFMTTGHRVLHANPLIANQILDYSDLTGKVSGQDCRKFFRTSGLS